MNKFLNKLKKILLINFEFKIPSKKKFLIVDSENIEIFERYLKKNEFNSINIRNLNFNFFILFKTILNLNFTFEQYLVEYIRFTKPKCVLTFNDNNIVFYKLKNFFKNDEKKFISIQNGIRTKFGDLFGEIEEKKIKDLKSDYILVFGNEIKKIYEKNIDSKVLVIGSLKNNYFKNLAPNKKTLLYISSFNRNHLVDHNNKKNLIIEKRGEKKAKYYNIYNFDFELPNLLSSYCKKNNIKFSVSGRTNKICEKQFFKNIIKSKFKFIYRKNLFTTYRAMLKNNIIVGGPSTVLLEALARKKRIAIFNPKLSSSEKSYNFSWPKKTANKGFFYSNEINEKEVNRILDNIKNASYTKYKKKIKPFESLMIFDFKNNKFQKLIKIIKN